MNPKNNKLHLRPGLGRAMIKPIIIIFTLLAYALTLVHSLVPHHHHDEAAQVQSHHPDHDTDHHHDDRDERTISQVFEDAIHHPSAELISQRSQLEDGQKVQTLTAFFLIAYNQILLPDLKPPDNPISYQARHYSFNLSALSLLRAPPAI